MTFNPVRERQVQQSGKQKQTDASGKITTPSLSLPKGGGALKGLGDAFQPQSFTGAAGFDVPFPLSPARALTPQIGLTYSSGGEQGVFGMGFSLNSPSITRKTSNGIPRYEDTDVFLLSGTELVPEHDSVKQPPRVAGAWESPGPDSRWSVTAYRPRYEGSFALIERWLDTETREAYWRIVSADNVTSVYGRSPQARVADPENPAHIFRWLLEETHDACGNRVSYRYKAEDAEGVAPEVFEAGRDHTANRYLEQVEYGNYLYGGQELYAFKVIFDYGEYDPANPDAPAGRWQARPDPFSSYRSGFEIRTNRLCRHVLMYHQFQDEFDSKPFLVRALRFDYEQAAALSSTPGPSSGLSFLKRVTEIGFRKEDDGTYRRRALPPLELNYSAFEPAGRRYRRLRVEGGDSVPGYLGEAQYLPVDLYGEGLPGLLYSGPYTTLYWEPRGEGLYDPPQPPRWMPREKNLQAGNYTLASLNGNGVLDLVVNGPERSGFYRSTEEGQWEPYREFASRPFDLANDFRDMVDMTGDGRPDVLVFEDDRVKFYPSRGAAGYGAPQGVVKRPDFPAVENNYEEELLTFADVFGDGLQHRVRIRNGSVECWPNLGYGRFGRKVTLGNAPRFGETMSAGRLFLADVDGTGTADLVYVYDDHALVFFNQSGNRFSEPLRIPLPAPYDSLTQVSFADVLGNGTSCLLFTRAEPEVKHYYYDFCNDTKPYLLTEVSNGMGARTRVTYSSTVKQYLKDKRRGRPWVTKLFFPVHVVERVESYDELSGAKFVSLYKYHDGYYDPEEREFRGFGFVESWDTEDYEEFTAGSTAPAFPANAVNKQLHVPPVYTKTWYHTGAFKEASAVSRQYEREYWRGDAQAFSLPENTLAPEVMGQDGETVRQAFTALAGQMIRQEVYGLDGSEDEANPYQVSETNVHVRLIQPRGGNRYAVFYAYAREALTYHYERDPTDPRVLHDITLAVDEYGNVRRRLSISYPRRADAGPPVFPEQATLKAVLAETEYVNHPATEQESYRRLGVGYESRNFEAGGLSAPADALFELGQLEQAVEAALNNTVAPGQDPPSAPGGSSPWSRLLSWERTYFWDAEQAGALPLGEIDGKCLLHHQETAAFTTALIGRAFGGRVTNEMLEDDGGYFLADGYWWNRGLIQYYLDGPGSFSLPARTENGFSDVAADSSLHVRTDVTYDQYNLLPKGVSRYLSDDQVNTVTALNDYQTLSPWQLTDCNGNVTEVLFDPLGNVVATSVYGTAGDAAAGDDPLSAYQLKPATFEEVLDNPATYLQGSTSYFYYDLWAWPERGQPSCVVTLQREKHVRQLRSGEEGEIQVSVSYGDGYGRVIESKARTDAGAVAMRAPLGGVLREAQGRPLQSPPGQRWIVSGRTVYNNKGNPAEQYQPYFSATPDYEDQAAITDGHLVPPPTIIRYDALQRVIRTDSPKGFFSQVKFTPWEVQSYDENDTVLDSVYYRSFAEAYAKFDAQHPASPGRALARAKQALDDEYDALSKAAACYNTPAVAILDNQGRTFRSVVNNLGRVSPDDFARIAEGSGYTPEEVFNELVARDYLTADGWVTQAFQPYTVGFNLQLDTDYLSLAGPITDYLKESCLTTLYVLDFEGREVASADPRLFYSNLTRQKSYYNFEYLYDLGGAALSTESADAGLRLNLNNIFGNSIHAWDGRGFHVASSYDRLQRPLQVQVVLDDGPGDGGIWLTERYVYGEGQADDQSLNLRGQVYQSFDQAGVVTNEVYGLGGQAMSTTRQLREDYKQEVDWSGEVPLEDEVFTGRTDYDALGRVLIQVAPDNSVHIPTYNQAGQLVKVEAILDDGALAPDEAAALTGAGRSERAEPEAGAGKTFVEHIDYDANGQRTRIRYGNGVETRYRYEPTTLRLLGLKTTRLERGAKRPQVLQDIEYTYDPVGNITRTRDRSWETAFCYNQQVSPVSDYAYDALYRLTSATGRQHPGLQAPQGEHRHPRAGVFVPACPPDPNDQKKLEQYTQTYSYDDAGNLLQTRHSASRSWTRAVTIAPDSNHGFPDDSPRTAYDANGNLLRLDHLRSVAWNYRNNIANVVIIARPDALGDDAEFYVYDGAGRRVRKVFERVKAQGSVTEVEEKIYLGGYEVKRVKTVTEGGAATTLERRTLRITDDGACVCVVHHWTKDLRNREAKAEGARQFRYQLADRLGSVAMEVDAQAQLISYEEYYPYGGTAFAAGANAAEVRLKEYRYSGQEQDAATGLYYYGMRYYAPWLGRWMSPDPAGAVDGLNLYAFVGGNPVAHRDAGGLGRVATGKRPWKPPTKTPKGQLKKKAKIDPQVGEELRELSSMSVEDADDWTRAWRKMSKGKTFEIEVFPNVFSTEKTAVLERRKEGEDKPPNLYLSKRAGFGGSRDTLYTTFSKDLRNAAVREDFVRVGRRVIKGTLPDKDIPAGINDRVLSDAAVLGTLAMTAERGRSWVSPFMALITLGFAKAGPPYKPNFTEIYIPAGDGGAARARTFGQRFEKLTGTGKRAPDNAALEEFYADYEDFFDATNFYLSGKDYSKLPKEFKDLKTLATSGTQADTVIAFSRYISYMSDRYPHLKDT